MFEIAGGILLAVFALALVAGKIQEWDQAPSSHGPNKYDEHYNELHKKRLAGEQ